MIGTVLIIVGVALCSLLILAAFTPIGLVALPFGVAFIAAGALMRDRANRRAP